MCSARRALALAALALGLAAGAAAQPAAQPRGGISAEQLAAARAATARAIAEAEGGAATAGAATATAVPGVAGQTGTLAAADPTLAEPGPLRARRLGPAAAAAPPEGFRGATAPLPGLTLTDTGDVGLPVQLLLLLTVLTLAPSILILMTSFTRLLIVLAILRTAIGLTQSPPTQVLVGLALFLTFFVMNPVFERVDRDALQPYLAGQLTQAEALEIASVPMKGFMLEHTREKDLVQFLDLAGITALDRPADVPLHVLVPAFVVSELRVAFQIGFMLFLPFLVVDLIVASVLMSMGMMMLPPVMISLPIKLLLFVLTDGWALVVESLVRGYL